MGVATFSEVLRAAVADLAEHGYDNRERVDAWLVRLREAAAQSLIPETQLRQRLTQTLGARFRQHMRTTAVKRHRGMDRFTLKRIEPALRAELDKRIIASAKLITLNREASIQKTLQRFQGWATAIPVGGSRAVERGEVAEDVGKAVRRIPYEDRRVAIDQGHKLIAAIDDVIAIAGEAVAAIWHSHWRETGYDYRPEHKRLDGKVFLLRDSWATKQGLVKRPAGELYTDQIEAPAVAPFCRCYFQYCYSIADLPRDFLTGKGKMALNRGDRHVATA